MRRPRGTEMMAPLAAIEVVDFTNGGWQPDSGACSLPRQFRRDRESRSHVHGE
jgi:hypothetical protein